MKTLDEGSESESNADPQLHLLRFTKRACLVQTSDLVSYALGKKAKVPALTDMFSPFLRHLALVTTRYYWRYWSFRCNEYVRIF